MSIRWQYPHLNGRIDAAIVDYDTPELAQACWESVRDCDLFRSVALVDAKRSGWSYAQAVNTALRGSHGDIVLALNADTRMLESPAAVVALFDSDPTVGVVGPRQVDPDGRIVHGGIFGTNTDPRFRAWQQPLQSCKELTADTQDAVTVSGSVYFARRACWDAVGGFLEVPKIYFEETWMSYKARHLGWRVLYTGSTTWEHRWNSTPIDGKAQMAAESREVFRAACSAEGILCD